MTNKIIALTGGTGFLGLHLVEALLSKGYTVRLLRRPGSVHPKMKMLPANVEGRDVDFADTAALAKACAGAGAVIHAAGLVSYNRKDQANMQETHVALTNRVLEAARRAGVTRFIHVSSIVTLGHSDVPRDETAEYDAAELHLAYWDTKAEAENSAIAANHPPEFEVVVVNPGSLLGPGEKNGQLLPFVKKLASSERPFLPDGGSDFLDVRDAARGTVLALEKGKAGERYVLGSENLTYAGFHKKLRAAMGKRSAPRILPRWTLAAAENMLGALESLTGVDLPINAARLRRVNGVYMFHDISKAKKELGYQPGPIEPALRAMLEE